MKYKTCEKCARSVGPVNVLGNIMMILLKGYIGVVGGSKALIADAIHSSADLLATLIMIIGLRVSSRTADEKFPYGYGKSEYVVAIAIYISLFMIGTYILIDGVRVIFSGHMSTPSFLAIWGAVFSITINELMFRLTICAGTQVGSPSMVATVSGVAHDFHGVIFSTRPGPSGMGIPPSSRPWPGKPMELLSRSSWWR